MENHAWSKSGIKSKSGLGPGYVYVDTKKWENATYDFDRVLLRVLDT